MQSDGLQELKQQIQQILLTGLDEDHFSEDITTQACVSQDKKAVARFVLKQKSVVAGISFLPFICKTVDPTLKCEVFSLDGKEYEEGTTLASLEGSAFTILSFERTALNILQHASGIASLTAEFVKAIEGFECVILDTRKTLPGLRALQKYAVTMGGGTNHRFHLADRFLIKNNHLKLLKQTYPYPVREAIRRARILRPDVKIEVEVETLNMLEEALLEKADLILLDNMTVSLVKEAVKIAKTKAYLEASGGITLKNVRSYAETGVDGISIGALTHSVKATDISLRII